MKDGEKNKPSKLKAADMAIVNSGQKDLPLKALRTLIYGQPLATGRFETNRLRKLFALPVFCSDAISSVAYGGQQILLALTMAGLWLPQYSNLYSHHTIFISLLIALVLFFVSVSYWQTIFAYPSGGGSYIVTKDNLGTTPGLVAAAALLIDYVLCVSVSIASGMQNLRDVPLLSGLDISHHMVIYCVGAIVLMTWLNLRGLRQPALFFAIPVYVFIFMCYVMIVLGFGADHFGWTLHREYANQIVPSAVVSGMAASAFGIAVVLRAFATGCSALTGVEAVSNGIPAFQEPQSKNAAVTLVWMAIILGTIFIGVSALAVKLHIVYWENHGTSAAAVIDQISGTVFGKQGIGSIFYNITQFATALILLIAAQTSFADFPRVASILARDGFMPRQLANLGDRLAFDNGIVILGILSTVFIVAKKGSVDLLIPFFTIGVFLAFTLSQVGMVRHWFKVRNSGWPVKACLNGIGALATFVVLIDIVMEKFIDGAWFVIILICFLFFAFKKIAAHYQSLDQNLTITEKSYSAKPLQSCVLVLVQGIHTGTMKSLNYARSISNDCQAIYVEINPEATATLKDQWKLLFPDIPLVVLASPFRSLLRPFLAYLDEVHKEHPHKTLTVVVGEYVPSKWWHTLLHGNTGLLLKLALLGRPDVVVANVRYCVDGAV